MKTIEIKNRFTNETIYSGNFENLKECVEDAVKMGVSLMEANLTKADLREANLKGADLDGAYLREADLDGANLKGADLDGANLYGADLMEANLTKANLDRATLCGADLDRADLREATLCGATLYGANLDRARNYYSFIAYDTSKRLVHCIKYKDTWKVQAGCFWGTLEELEAKVKKVHNSKVYLANIEILKEL
jgi:hypothetical protein